MTYKENVRTILESNFSQAKDELIDIAVDRICELTPTDSVIEDIKSKIEDFGDEELDLLIALMENEVNCRCLRKGLNPEEVEGGGIAWYNYPDINRPQCDAKMEVEKC